jgi:uncharacterized Fe-S cluster protein YjdI
MDKNTFYSKLHNTLLLKYNYMGLETLHYSNGEITINWKPDICIHSGICVKGLAKVFNPGRKPWIDMSKAETQQIIDQVKKCPSGALSIEHKSGQ